MPPSPPGAHIHRGSAHGVGAADWTWGVVKELHTDVAALIPKHQAGEPPPSRRRQGTAVAVASAVTWGLYSNLDITGPVCTCSSTQICCATASNGTWQNLRTHHHHSITPQPFRSLGILSAFLHGRLFGPSMAPCRFPPLASRANTRQALVTSDVGVQMVLSW
jgi:hypothetical protein